MIAQAHISRSVAVELRNGPKLHVADVKYSQYYIIYIRIQHNLPHDTFSDLCSQCPQSILAITAHHLFHTSLIYNHGSCACAIVIHCFLENSQLCNQVTV